MGNERTKRPWSEEDCHPGFLAQFRRRQRERQERHTKMHQHHARIHQHQEELHQYNRYFKFLQPLMLLFNLAVLYLLFRLFGIKTISIFFAAFVILAAVMQFFLFLRIEKRILAPVSKLIRGVQEISKGNYAVKVEGNIPNDIGSLIISFNEMALKLQESERLKAEYEENRKTLVANISHDLKTPITSMQGYLEALLEGVVTPDKAEQYLKTIYNNTLYTNKLIDDLFLFTKLDMQKLNFKFESVQLRRFMYDLFEEFQFELAERQVKFYYTDNLEEDLTVNLDGKRLQQAIRNIIGNAVKHGPAEDLTVHAKLYKQVDTACIDISDNGPGISPDKLPHIFDRFYRIDRERTKDLLSTGLGLAIAKELIEAHGGNIKVSSVEGDGTCFTIMLPISKQQGDGLR